MALRAHHQPSCILHTRPYSETSLLVDAFTREHGRVSLLAKGARRIKSKVRGIIRPFQPLLLSWSGKGELQVLTGAEPVGVVAGLDHASWLCGCYMNELLVKTLHRHDAHEALYDYYALTLDLLRNGKSRQIALRLFEKQLLAEIGYGLLLARDASNDQPVCPGNTYRYHPGRGPVLAAPMSEQCVWHVDGATLLALDNEYFPGRRELEQSKYLLRALLHHCLHGRELKSREVLQGLNALR